MARQPTSPDERVNAVPAQLSAIVMKLLAKTAEERYQTAAGVEADLRQCLAEWESHGRINPFSLSARNALDRLVIPEKLYGRNREIDTLLAAFVRVATIADPPTGAWDPRGNHTIQMPPFSASLTIQIHSHVGNFRLTAKLTCLWRIAARQLVEASTVKLPPVISDRCSTRGSGPSLGCDGGLRARREGP
jgi:hypothetical protein